MQTGATASRARKAITRVRKEAAATARPTKSAAHTRSTATNRWNKCTQTTITRNWCTQWKWSWTMAQGRRTREGIASSIPKSIRSKQSVTQYNQSIWTKKNRFIHFFSRKRKTGASRSSWKSSTRVTQTCSNFGKATTIAHATNCQFATAKPTGTYARVKIDEILEVSFEGEIRPIALIVNSKIQMLTLWIQVLLRYV